MKTKLHLFFVKYIRFRIIRIKALPSFYRAYQKHIDEMQIAEAREKEIVRSMAG